jgi:hypothetical protein
LLIRNHVLGFCSCLGLLPSWLQDKIEVAASNRYMKWFLGEFNLPGTPYTMEQITESLKHALSTSHGIPFSSRKVKNVLCKVYRNQTDSTSDKRFCDLAFKGQMLFTCEGKGLRIYFPSETGLPNTVVGDYLVTKWAFGNTLLLVEDIVGSLGMSDKGVPTSKEAENWTVPLALMFGQAHTEVEFDIGHNVEVLCDKFFKFRFRKLSGNLCG